MRKVFKNIDNNRLFFIKGYVQVPNFLTKEEIEQIRNVYFEHYKDNFEGFHACMHSTDVAYRRKVHAEISKLFATNTNSLLAEYKPLVGNFTVKEPGLASFFDFHLDWSMLDEKKARSITVWVALEDTNAHNGNLWILENSTHMGHSWRCSPGLHLYAENNKQFLQFRGLKKELPMKAGDAFIYDHKLFHGSPPNLGKEPRLAINLAMIPAESQSLHYHVSDNAINAHQVDDDFYCRCLTHSPMEMNPYPIIESFPLSEKLIEQDEVNALIENY